MANVKVIPPWQDVAREAIIVMGGALVAAFIVGQVPQLREWMKQQWAGAIPQGDKSAW
ncbi:hypothetical protein [Limnohabitans sp.]|uniref:hypothetical protein n=1 Tax=Limnohabitans sp. TaxID=1907725 RepID=UPI00286EBE24|nr:hypothetical protein [Limnohabitans sp.]